MNSWIKPFIVTVSVFSCLPNVASALPSKRQDTDWRSVACDAPGVTDHTLYGPDRWALVNAGGAWASVLEGWGMNLTEGRPQIHFSNNVCSNSFKSQTWPIDMLTDHTRSPTTFMALKTCSVR